MDSCNVSLFHGMVSDDDVFVLYLYTCVLKK
jgi:hypothetical protein